MLNCRLGTLAPFTLVLMTQSTGKRCTCESVRWSPLPAYHTSIDDTIYWSTVYVSITTSVIGRRREPTYRVDNLAFWISIK